MGLFTGACPTQQRVGPEWACDEDTSTVLSVTEFKHHLLICNTIWYIHSHITPLCGTPSNAGHINSILTVYTPQPDLFIILFLFCPFIHWHMVICNRHNNILVGELVVIISNAHSDTLGSRGPFCVTQVGVYVAQSMSSFGMPCSHVVLMCLSVCISRWA